jgi:pentalenene synthase
MSLTLFPARINPHFDRAPAAYLPWLRSFGLFATAEEEQKHVEGRYGELAARFHPTATGPGLILAIDQMNWFFCFDDAFDGVRGDDPILAEQLVAAVAGVLDNIGPGSPEALARSFADVWSRSCMGMSAEWRERAARHWRTYLFAHIIETANRQRRRRLTVKEHLRLRCATVGVQPTLDMSERACGYEVPAAAFDHAHLGAMRTVITEITSIDNDVYSLAKEEAAEEPHNVILILSKELGISREQALVMATRMIDERISRFLALRDQVDEMCGALQLARAQRGDVRRYVHDALETMLRAPVDWSAVSGRYLPTMATSNKGR